MPNEKEAATIARRRRTKGRTFQRISNPCHIIFRFRSEKPLRMGRLGWTTSLYWLHHHCIESSGTLNKRRALHTEVLTRSDLNQLEPVFNPMAHQNTIQYNMGNIKDTTIHNDDVSNNWFSSIKLPLPLRHLTVTNDLQSLSFNCMDQSSAVGSFLMAHLLDPSRRYSVPLHSGWKITNDLSKRFLTVIDPTDGFFSERPTRPRQCATRSVSSSLYYTLTQCGVKVVNLMFK